MAKLLLIRHAQPKIQEGVSSNQWRLSETGRTNCVPFSARIKPYLPAVFLSSDEPKAAETIAIIARQLGQTSAIEADLHEHERTNAPFLKTGEAFTAAVQGVLTAPDALVFGDETGKQALHRFDAAIRRVIERHPEKNIVIGTHGTVMALFVAKYNRLNIVEFWRSLAMPDMVVLSHPYFILE